MSEEAKQEVEETTEPRRLKTSLFFPFLRMVRAMDGPYVLKEFVSLQNRAANAEREAVAQAGDDADLLDELLSQAQNEIGMEIAGLILQCLPDAEEETMEFLVRYTGLTRSELDDQDLGVTINQVIEVFQDPLFKGFLLSAVKGTRSNS